MCSEPHIPRQRDSCLTSNVRQKMKSDTTSRDIIPIVASHGLMLITALATALFVFPWFASEYFNTIGSFPAGFRHARDLNNFISSFIILIIPLLPLLAWADFKFCKKIKEEGSQSLLSYWSLLLTSLFCVFMIWFLFSLSSPERFIERQRKQDTERAPNQALQTTTRTVTPAASHPSRQRVSCLI